MTFLRRCIVCAFLFCLPFVPLFGREAAKPRHSDVVSPVVPAVASDPVKIEVFASSSLKNVLEEIVKEFSALEAGVVVKLTVGGSGELLQRVRERAQADLFLSADMRDLQELEQRGMLASGSVRPFAKNELVFIVPGDSGLSAKGIEDLGKASWEKIAVGDPKSVPVGKYAAEAIKFANALGQIREKLVYRASARQVLEDVVNGEVTGGFVFLTDAWAAKPRTVKQLFEVPGNFHYPILYGCGRLASATHPEKAERFVSYLMGSGTREILTNAGFSPAF